VSAERLEFVRRSYARFLESHELPLDLWSFRDGLLSGLQVFDDPADAFAAAGC
jgi:hypothetical protein